MSLFRRATSPCPACGKATRRDLGEKRAGPRVKRVGMKCPACGARWKADLDSAWWVLHRTAAGRIRRVKVGADMAAARDIEAGIRVAKIEGRYTDRAEECRTTLGELAELFGNAFEAAHPGKPRNAQTYRTALRQAVKLIGGSVRLDQIDSKAIEDYRAACFAQNPNGKVLAVASVNRRLAILGSALSWAVRQGLVAKRPKIRLPAVDNARNVFLTKEQAADLVKACQVEGAWLARFVRWALATGMRKGEALAMRWEWLDLARGLLTIPAAATKTKRSRTLPINRTMGAVLAEAEAEAGRAPGLPVLHEAGRPLSLHRLDDAFLRALERAKLPHMRIHDLRHCAAGFMAEASVDLFRLAMTLGHVDLSQVRRYANLQPNHLREALAATEVDPLPAPPPTEPGEAGQPVPDAAQAGSGRKSVPPAIPRIIQFPKKQAASA